MNPAKITCIEDLRQIYQRRVPRMFYDYCDTGSYTTGTYRRQHQGLREIQAPPARGPQH